MTALEFSHQIIGHKPSLTMFTKKFTQDTEYSKDLVQDTILKALSNRDKFREHTNLKGWLFTIMRNVFINTYRKSRSFQKVSPEAGDYYIGNKMDSHTFNLPDKSFEYQELLNKVEELPNQLRAPFEAHFNGYKYQEISDELNVPIGTVKNRIFQARKLIQKQVSA